MHGRGSGLGEARKFLVLALVLSAAINEDFMREFTFRDTRRTKKEHLQAASSRLDAWHRREGGGTPPPQTRPVLDRRSGRRVAVSRAGRRTMVFDGVAQFAGGDIAFEHGLLQMLGNDGA